MAARVVRAVAAPVRDPADEVVAAPAAAAENAGAWTSGVFWVHISGFAVEVFRVIIPAPFP